ncbi:ciliary microtubule inner protein 2C [Mixophyes fleayi]|uniref:ciliary microtubule inner protein 2C n=1 Tax=Mixophyes fleayi TaxID=3061075 RepID=UPI003F4D8750
MASRSAGTLITDNNATYIPPALMPGYRGYVPSEAFTYGDTYGNTTARSFQDFRSAALNSSQSPYCKGGQFPTSYSNDPALVLSNRSRSLDRFLYRPNWSRYNVDFNRTQELNQFRKSAQQHRDHYRDNTGTVHQVPHFILPVNNEDTYPLPQQSKIKGKLLSHEIENCSNTTGPKPLLYRTVCISNWQEQKPNDIEEKNSAEIG